ncbi:GDSL esterase/lipase At5g03610-like [Nicotiana tabacum]|uniref:GDSL esterase/lipase At5g03610-like n=1 Tax=Nicotiana tabacum TaxID=4097 RepID=A0A1S3YXD5_TOBAC|nr:PREDICTED: GDSL esterase/lipase At5g03610-like [Nicotiana tabacum]
MENKACFIWCLCLFTYMTIFPAVDMFDLKVDTVKRHNGKHKLFVFGDSYVDTGNWPTSMSSSWKEPYGLTYPGSPSGRFSDGLVLTDFIASFLGIRSPLPYTKKGSDGKSSVKDGVNFAYGGTGVFNTFVNQPNMTTQINYFQQLIQEEEVYTKKEMSSSIALVSVAGNDYATFLTKNGNNMDDLGDITKSIISQLELNLRRIHGLGVSKIGITAMEPIGCLPRMTAASSYENCSDSANSLSIFHNEILHQTIEKLNNQTGKPVFVILDIYNAFISALDIQQNHPGNSNFEKPLKPCCSGTSSEYSCGDKKGMRKNYVLCRNPELSFFWDVIHPSQQGWFAVFSALKPSLRSLL